MAPATPPNSTVSFETTLEPATLQALDRSAKTHGKTRDELIKIAVTAAIDDPQAFLAAIHPDGL